MVWMAWGVMAASPGWRLCAQALNADERAVPAAPAGRLAPTAEETLSSSGQFVIRGGSAEERSDLAMRADEVRADLVLLLERAEPLGGGLPAAPAEAGEPQPVHLRIDPAAVKPAAAVRQIEGAARPTFHLVLAGAGAARSSGFREELVRLLLAERMLRGPVPSTLAQRQDLVPAWLAVGVLEAMEHARLRSPSRRFAAIFEAGQSLAVEEILTARPERLDPVSREIFAASACGLVLMLLDQPQGPQRFQQLLANMAASTESWQRQLVRTFPGLALSRQSLEKWWSLQLASLAQPEMTEFAGAAQTDRQLEAALSFRHTPAEPERGPLRSFFAGLWRRSGEAEPPPQEMALTLQDHEVIAALPGREKFLAPAQRALAELHLRAFPLHREVIDGYQQVLGRLMKGSDRGVAADLQALQARREEILETAQEMEDLLDWHQATQRDQPSGAFSDFLRQARQQDQQRLRRTDAISRYLDELEAEYR